MSNPGPQVKVTERIVTKSGDVYQMTLPWVDEFESSGHEAFRQFVVPESQRVVTLITFHDEEVSTFSSISSSDEDDDGTTESTLVAAHYKIWSTPQIVLAQIMQTIFAAYSSGEKPAEEKLAPIREALADAVQKHPMSRMRRVWRDEVRYEEQSWPTIDAAKFAEQFLEETIREKISSMLGRDIDDEDDDKPAVRVAHAAPPNGG